VAQVTDELERVHVTTNAMAFASRNFALRGKQFGRRQLDHSTPFFDSKAKTDKLSRIMWLTKCFRSLPKLMLFLFAELFLLGSASQIAPAQQPVASQSNLSNEAISRIIKTFSAKETAFRHALLQYSFKRDALVQSLGMGGQITGEYHRVSYFTFDDKGVRYEKISHFPAPTFGGVTPEDLEDLGGINPFALEPSKIDQYNIKYFGKEKIDELTLYVFDVTPKVIPDPKKTKERFFTGRIWVDDQDLQIVKTRGKGVPETKTNKFPTVETYREEIDGRYWFPTYSYADEELIYEGGASLHVRLKVRYTDFAPARVTVTITEAEGPAPKSNQAVPAPQPSPTPSEQSVNPGMIQGGILNKKAIELPEPEYPEDARKAGVAGKVIVEVIVDETGKVISAEIGTGQRQLRRVSLEAARKARFKPTLVDGQPVKVIGVIEYLFAP
jgi:TonB family protein